MAIEFLLYALMALLILDLLALALFKPLQKWWFRTFYDWDITE